MMLWEIQFLYDAGIVLTDLTTTTSGSVSSASATHSSYPASSFVFVTDGKNVVAKGSVDLMCIQR